MKYIFYDAIQSSNSFHFINSKIMYGYVWSHISNYYFRNYVQQNFLSKNYLLLTRMLYIFEYATRHEALNFMKNNRNIFHSLTIDLTYISLSSHR